MDSNLYGAFPVKRLFWVTEHDAYRRGDQSQPQRSSKQSDIIEIEDSKVIFEGQIG